jgi:dephospho-CoA kinase
LYVVFLAGGIASGKSTVSAELVRLGAWRLDLDEVSRSVCSTGSPTTLALAARFGDDVVDPLTGELDRHLLAERAFSSPEGVSSLEAIEMPAIRSELVHALTNSCCAATEPEVCVVEVPLLDRVADLVDLADEVLVISSPLETRRQRACGRGMDVADFDRRVSAQPSDAYLVGHADTVIDNSDGREHLIGRVRSWWRSHVADGWTSPRKVGTEGRRS